MKKNKILRLGLLALALTLVTASLVSGTFAKYVTTVNGTGIVTVANWQVEVDGDGGTYEAGTETGVMQTASFSVLTTTDTGVKGTALVAPGTAGTFALKYKTVGTEVAHNVKITLVPDGATTTTIKDLEYLLFSTDSGSTWKNIDEFDGTSGYLHSANYTATSPVDETVTVNVQWKWPFDAVTNAGQDDALDTADGIANKTYQLLATLVATQLDVQAP